MLVTLLILIYFAYLEYTQINGGIEKTVNLSGRPNSSFTGLQGSLRIIIWMCLSCLP